MKLRSLELCGQEIERRQQERKDREDNLESDDSYHISDEERIENSCLEEESMYMSNKKLSKSQKIDA